jgi:two-component system cell cycle response regulator DivK
MARRSIKVGPRPLVLVVEDDQDCRDIYAESLTYFGFRVTQACDAYEALQKVRERRPDIIATDIGLPGMDGCELCVLIKGDARTKEIPVIAVTAWAMKGEVKRFKLAGFDSLLTKPCLPNDLRTEIQRLLKLTVKKHKK